MKRVGRREGEVGMKMGESKKGLDKVELSLMLAAFGQSLAGMVGSLYFSEVLKFPPCVLCWYQRIAMYPVALIVAVGIMKEDKRVYEYVLPLSGVGWVIAVYHNLLYYQLLPESTAPCVAGVSCTTKFVEWFGVITIPLLALMGFTVINLMMAGLWWRQRNEKR